jgi:hypothetical protein
MESKGTPTRIEGSKQSQRLGTWIQWVQANPIVCRISSIGIWDPIGRSPSTQGIVLKVVTQFRLTKCSKKQEWNDPYSYDCPNSAQPTTYNFQHMQHGNSLFTHSVLVWFYLTVHEMGLRGAILITSKIPKQAVLVRGNSPKSTY